jgi:hypothetical protein
MSGHRSKELDTLRKDAERLAGELAQSSSRDEALEIAITAAETSMKALSLVSNPDEKKQYSAQVRQYMRDAERIKDGEDWRAVRDSHSATNVKDGPAAVAVNSKVRTLKEPQNSRKLPTREQVILLKSGFLNGVKFPQWSKTPDQSEFEKIPGEDMFLYVSLYLDSHSSH